jgi:DNA-binding GntR family transcriptional regulator
VTKQVIPLGNYPPHPSEAALPLSQIPPSNLLALRESAYLALRNGLIQGAFEPGVAVSVRSLAEKLELGITPVREAVQRLVAERALEITRSRTLRVPMMNVSELKELYAIRMLLEGYATRRAAVRFTATDEIELGSVRRALIQAHQRIDLPAALEYNRRFHFSIYAKCESYLLIAEIERLWVRAGPLLVSALDKSELKSPLVDSLDLISELCTALKLNRSQKAERLMKELLRNGFKWQRLHLLAKSKISRR